MALTMKEKAIAVLMVCGFKKASQNNTVVICNAFGISKDVLVESAHDLSVFLEENGI